MDHTSSHTTVRAPLVRRLAAEYGSLIGGALILGIFGAVILTIWEKTVPGLIWWIFGGGSVLIGLSEVVRSVRASVVSDTTRWLNEHLEPLLRGREEGNMSGLFAEWQEVAAKAQEPVRQLLGTASAEYTRLLESHRSMIVQLEQLQAFHAQQTKLLEAVKMENTHLAESHRSMIGQLEQLQASHDRQAIFLGKLLKRLPILTIGKGGFGQSEKYLQLTNEGLFEAEEFVPPLWGLGLTDLPKVKLPKIVLGSQPTISPMTDIEVENLLGPLIKFAKPAKDVPKTDIGEP